MTAIISKLCLIFLKSSEDDLNKLEDKIEKEFIYTVSIATMLTFLIYIVQLLLSMKSYQKTVLKAYRGVFEEIPNPNNISIAKLTSSSLHFTGYSIVFLLIGFQFLLTVNLVLVFVIRMIINTIKGTEIIKSKYENIYNYVSSKTLEYILIVFKIILPIIAIFILKKYLILLLSKYVLTNHSGKEKRLRNEKSYRFVNHFNFFFDISISFFVASVRIIYSMLFYSLYFPRLDYTTFDLGFTKFDLGYMSYVSYIHLEGIIYLFVICELIK